MRSSESRAPASTIAVVPRRYWTLAILLAVYLVNSVDRYILNVLGEAVKTDLRLSDLQIGLLAGPAFAMVNAASALPIARLAERKNRISIISVGLVIWSAMTALCGAVQTFGQLLAARTLVGISEAAGPSPSHSVIADIFPPHRRSLALSIFATGVPLGLLIGAFAGGWLAENHGWRIAFIIAGAPGILLALVMVLTVREPARGGTDLVRTDRVPPSLIAVARHMLSRKTYRHMIVAGMLLNVATAGILQFLHAYFQRMFGMAYGEAAYVYGLVSGPALFIGLLSGGILTNRWGAREPRIYLWLPAAGVALAAATYPMAFLQTDWHLCAVLAFVGGTAASTYFGPLFATAHNLAEPRMRATVTAFSALAMNGLGIAGGPLFVGLLSDRFASFAYGGEGYGATCADSFRQLDAMCQSAMANGLRFALIMGTLLYLWACIHFLIAARHIRHELAGSGKS